MDLLNAAVFPVILFGGYILLTIILLRIPMKDRD